MAAWAASFRARGSTAFRAALSWRRRVDLFIGSGCVGRRGGRNEGIDGQAPACAKEWAPRLCRGQPRTLEPGFKMAALKGTLGA